MCGVCVGVCVSVGLCVFVGLVEGVVVECVVCVRFLRVVCVFVCGVVCVVGVFVCVCGLGVWGVCRVVSCVCLYLDIKIKEECKIRKLYLKL